MTDGAHIDAALDAAVRHAGELRSSVRAWLFHNARDFQEKLKKRWPRRIPWRRVALGLYEVEGIKDSDGKPLKGAALRDAWYHVRKLHVEQGADWVEFDKPPKGKARLVKRKKAAPEPVGAGKPAPAVAAPVSADPPDATPPDLQGLFETRSWVPRVKS